MFRSAFFAGILALCGCAMAPERYRAAHDAAWNAPLEDVTARSAIPLPEPARAAESVDEAALSGETLALDELLAEVERRNPSLEAIRNAWRAAVARYPQVTALEDPMLMYGFGPETLNRPRVEESGVTRRLVLAPGSAPMFEFEEDLSRSRLDVAQRIEIAQRFPWPGKRALRGEEALHDAEAVREDLATERERLRHETKRAYYDYWYVLRATDTNDIERMLLDEFRDIAQSKYAAGTASKQDALQAEVEREHIEHDRIVLERMKKAAEARINALLNRRQDAPLPWPPLELPAPTTPPDWETVRRAALEVRPELRAIAAQIRSKEASIAIAQKEFYPDFVVSGVYDTFWEVDDQRSMISVGFNLPIQTARRRAAVEEARARRSQAAAELAKAAAEVEREAKEAFDRLHESEHVIRLYDERLFPAAEEGLDAARAGYVAGEVDFLALITAQRQLLDIRLRRIEAEAALHASIADLERAIGAPLHAINSGEHEP